MVAISGKTICKIPLTQGKFALIDKDDYEKISRYKWHVTKKEYKGKKHFYAERKIWDPETKKQKGIKMHNEILGGIFVDHKNGNGLDNRRCNLRFATSEQNSANRKPNRRKKTSKYKGVWYEKDNSSGKKWRAAIQVSGKRINLSRFETEIEAARAYDKAAIKYFGEFACINFPDGDSQMGKKPNEKEKKRAKRTEKKLTTRFCTEVNSFGIYRCPHCGAFAVDCKYEAAELKCISCKKVFVVDKDIATIAKDRMERMNNLLDKVRKIPYETIDVVEAGIDINCDIKEVALLCKYFNCSISELSRKVRQIIISN